MKKMKNNSNNAGFSLVEVLMAVVILGLIATPLLQMFYTSMELNIKSKKYLAAADLAQSRLEQISSCTWEDSKSYLAGNPVTPGLKTLYYPTSTDYSTPISGTHIHSGYAFTSKLYFDVPASPQSYYSVNVTCKIYDDKGAEVTSATTSVMNKR